jgi:hypothetical protein
MASVVEALDRAAIRLDDAVQDARLAGSALDGVSDPLAERVAEVAVRADEVRCSVVRARDALVDAGG